MKPDFSLYTRHKLADRAREIASGLWALERRYREQELGDFSDSAHRSKSIVERKGHIIEGDRLRYSHDRNKQQLIDAFEADWLDETQALVDAVIAKLKRGEAPDIRALKRQYAGPRPIGEVGDALVLLAIELGV